MKMKKYSYFVWMAIAVSSLAACTQEDLMIDSDNISSIKTIKFKPEFSNQSRTGFNQDFTGLEWSEGDVLGLYSDANDVNVKSTPVVDGYFSAGLSDKASKVYVYYPYMKAESYNDMLNGGVMHYEDTEIPVNIPVNQKQYRSGVLNGSNLPMLAETDLSGSQQDATVLQFNPLASVFSFKVYNSIGGDEKLQSISLSSSSFEIGGDYIYNISDKSFKVLGTRPKFKTINVGLDYNYKVPSSKPSGKNNNVYLVVAPLNYSNVTVAVTTDKNIYYVDMSSVNFDMTDVHSVKQISINLANATGIEKNYDLTSNEIPDNNFMKCLLENCDINGDNRVSYSEVLSTEGLEISSKSISSLKGIEYFKNLIYLHCEYNELTELDLNNNTKLGYLQLGHNKLTRLDITGCYMLNFFKCEYNELTELDVTGNSIICWMSAANNKLKRMDVSNVWNLQYMNVSNNQLTELIIGDKKENLFSLYLEKNQLTELDVTMCPILKTLSVYHNNLTSLDVSKCSEHMQYVDGYPQYKVGSLFLVDEFLFIKAVDQKIDNCNLPEVSEIKEVVVDRN